MKYFIIAFLIFATTACYSQVNSFKLQKARKKQSIEQINDLKNGVLLIRLKTMQRAIDYYRAKGEEKIAKKIEENQFKFNKTLIDAFKVNFNFCEFYFFSTQYSKFLKNKQFDSVFYFNSDLKIDKNIKPKISKFFVSEYCPIEADTTMTYSGTTVIQGDSGLEIKDTYYTQDSFGFEALIIRSSEFVQLAKPFPYYVRTWNSMKKPTKVVKQFNKKLYKYYYKANH